jgi:hypothetical protein
MKWLLVRQKNRQEPHLLSILMAKITKMMLKWWTPLMIKAILMLPLRKANNPMLMVVPSFPNMVVP